MGNSICKVDEGLFICGVPALWPYDRLRDLGIKCILNAAQSELYSSPQRMDDGSSVVMTDVVDKFKVLIIGAEDAADCNLSEHFARIADFIEAGRREGGVVVHCAAGISRASTSVMSYLMIKEHWELNAAFQKVFAVRRIIRPNPGFWRQLRDLEASLRAQGVELRPLPPGWAPKEEDADKAKDEAFMRRGGALETLQDLDDEAQNISSFVNRFLTARLVPSENVLPESLAGSLQDERIPGVTWENIAACDGSVLARAAVIPTMDDETLREILAQVRGVSEVVVEKVETIGKAPREAPEGGRPPPPMMPPPPPPGY